MTKILHYCFTLLCIDKINRQLSIISMSKKFIKLSLIFIFCLMTQVVANPNQQDYASLLERIDSIRVQHDIPGVSLVVVDKAGILHQSQLGLADRAKQNPVTSETIFRVGSITKTFTSLAALRLVEQQKLQLSDEVATYLTTVPYINTFQESSPIRVEQLLEHTAGFRDMSAHEWGFKEPDWTLEQSFAYDPESRTTHWRPGEHHSYSNSGAGVAAAVIEAITEENFEDFVRQEIFAPLGFKDATFYLTDQVKQRLATGYNSDGHSLIPYWHMLYRPFGAMNMNAGEMAAFIRFLLNEGELDGKRIFSKRSIARLEIPRSTLAARHGLAYGYGLGNYSWVRNNAVFHGHGGDADGYLAHYGYTRANDKGYFVVINAFHGRALRAMRKEIESWLINDIKQETNLPVAQLSSKQKQAIIGNYMQITQRFNWEQDGHPVKENTLVIFEKQEELYTRINDAKPKQLVPVSKIHFRRVNQPVATISINTDQNGAMILQGDMGNFKKIQ